MTTKMKRPNMKAYFQARIDFHVHGLMASTIARYPHGVVHVEGDVTDPIIKVTMRDRTVYQWAGGEYASRKVNGCYAPKMPRPISQPVTP